MSNEKDEQFQQFKQEEIRKQGTRLGVARILKSLPVKIDSAYTVEQATDGVIEQLKQTYELVPNDSGSWVKGFTRDGKEIDLTATVEDALLTSPFVDKASVHEAVESGSLSVTCKADLRDVPSRVRYISRHGEAAFSALPMTRQPKPIEFNPDTCTAAQYRDLTRATKMKLFEAGKLNDAIIAKIMSRK